MLLHICTNESLFQGAIPMSKKKCPICCEETTSRSGYVGIMCDRCRKVYDPFEEHRGSIARKRRELLKLTRRELGKLMGYSTKTIKQYEWVKCSKKYFDKLEELVKEKFVVRSEPNEDINNCEEIV